MSQRQSVYLTVDAEIDIDDALAAMTVEELESALFARNERSGFSALASDTDFQLAVQRGDSATVLHRVAAALAITPRSVA